jgi:endogenous inhibitor of DNA gyrase (YacG/DUF329 family)
MILEEETYKRFGYFPRDLTVKSNKAILVACDDCGKIRQSSKHAYRSRCKSCGNRIAKLGKNNPNWKGGDVKRICKTCGKEFERSPSHMNGNNQGLYCSKSCAMKARTRERAAAWRGGQIECVCETCGKQFSTKPSVIKIAQGRFCSLHCARKDQKGANNPAWHGGRMTVICNICGKEFKVHPSVYKKGFGRFCSSKCRSIAYRGKNHPNWQGGISYAPYCHKFNAEFKEYIRTKFGRVCFLCGKTEVENRKRLSVHHVNYNKNCGCAETEEDKKADDNSCQFVPLCVSCNSKVNGNRDLWERRIKTKMRNKLNGWYI